MTDTGLLIQPPDTSGLSFNSGVRLRASIAQAVAQTVPDGAHGAAVAVVDLDGSMHFVVAQKLGEHWDILGSLDKDGKHVSGSVKIAGSW